MLNILCESNGHLPFSAALLACAPRQALHTEVLAETPFCLKHGNGMTLPIIDISPGALCLSV